MERRGVRGAFCKLPRDSLSLISFAPIKSQHDMVYWWVDKDGNRMCLYSDDSGLYNTLIGIIKFD